MFNRKFLHVLFSLCVVASLVLGGSVQVQPVKAMPMDPMDESKVPHYFGPYPNWANSPFTLPNATVEIQGDGSGATAVAQVDPVTGGIASIAITSPGSGYTSASVVIGGGDGSATATATVSDTGVVVGFTNIIPGSGYSAFDVALAGGGGSGATAVAYGGVDQVTISDGGSGYTFPTVDFDLPDGPGGVQARAYAEMNENGTITNVVVTNPGSGYSTAPGVAIHNGDLFNPINGATLATASTTLQLTSVEVVEFGSGYTGAPAVTISDPTGSGSGAAATALTDVGAVVGIEVTNQGSGYLDVGMRKFVDTLPGLSPAGANNLGQYIPIAVPDTETFPGADYYEIAVVQFQEQMHSDLPPTTLRGYVQLETSKVTGSHYALPNGKFGVDKPHFLGPAIIAQKDRPVRITFYNLLPTGEAGDLFLPVDSTLMGSGMAEMNEPFDPVPTVGGSVMDEARNPMCTDARSMGDMCFPKNRATLHLHGGNTPWISDGTPHQWISPAGENTNWPEGVSVANVPDMVGVPGVPDCSGPNDGCQTFYYTNQQSARLMFYHDHSWGITRLNVYAGEAAAYLITDQTEGTLVSNGIIPSEQIPLVIQDRTFVPDEAQLAWQDPTWDVARWGSKGNFWYHHVYMPAQNPGDPSGMSAYGRWMYGPWFWPPAGDAKYGPIDNPYYDPDCHLDDPATWTYDIEPFCEPQLIPGTPNISVGMEQFNDTPIVNGTAYPTVTLEPKAYRFRILNAANDRFFNFQWYVGDASTASANLNSKGEPIGATEVALNPAELAAAQLDPVVFPTPDLSKSPAGPDWIQIGTEGGFLPSPVLIDGQQVTTWITDPTRFDVGNVDKHSLLLAPAERADVIVDFSKFAGQTLILYNDAPAAFPARVPSYDYYTGAPDLTPVGAPTILPGYGPNTRTIMQVKIAGSPAPSFNLAALQSAFRHKANGSGVFEAGQPPIIVGQAPYNSAYGSSFVSGAWCNSPSKPTTKCDGYARISEQGGDLFKFDTLSGKQVSIPLEPKAIHDEMNASSFDEYGRMQANLGVEVVPATPGLQNVVLHPYVFPPTEIIDTTKLPTADVKVTPISQADGTQIWKITHNGVDTHPIHFHAYDVQVLNRVTWDNIIIPPDANELGWKDTVRISPLEDTIVALRPIIPKLPFDLPNSIRLISPMMAEGAEIALSSVADALGLGMTAFNPDGEPIDVYNHYVNFGAEYVYHCHILSHEEMDMMRPVLFAFPPVAPSDLTVTSPIGNGNARHVDLMWKDNSRSETAFVIQRATSVTGPWTTLATLQSATGPDVGGMITYSDVIGSTNQTFVYKVQAINVVGDTWDYADPAINEIVQGGFPTVTTVSAFTNTATWAAAPAAPSNLNVTLQAGPQASLTWTDNANNESGFVVERSVSGGAFTQLAVAPARNGTGSVTFIDTGVVAGTTYQYRVAAANAGGMSAYSNTATLVVPAMPAAPSNFTAVNGPNGNGNNRTVILTWTDNSNNETGFTIQRATNATFTAGLNTANVAANTTTLTQTGLSRNTNYYYRIRANNGTIIFSAWVNATPFPIRTNP